MTRLRSMQACWWSSKEERSVIFFSDMVGPLRLGGLKRLRGLGGNPRGSTWLGSLTATGMTRLKERFGLVGVFLEIFWRMRKTRALTAEEPKHRGRLGSGLGHERTAGAANDALSALLLQDAA